MATTRTREQWAALIGTFEQSSQPIEQFCAAEGVVPATLRWWRWRLRQAAPVPPVRRLRGTAAIRPDESVQLLPVSVRPEAVVADGGVAGCAIAIAVSGVEVRVAIGADIAYVTALVASLRA